MSHVSQEERSVIESRPYTMKDVNELAQRVYQESGRAFRPLFPWCFLAVLTKEQTTKAGLVLPQIEQNKTVHEAIVLATWAPGEYYVKGKKAYRESTFKPGDHVLFPHWAGMPIEGFEEKHFRVVKEEEWSPSGEGGIFAKVEYDGMRNENRLTLAKIHAEYADSPGDMIAEIEYRFLLIDRDKQSVTLSGR